jgi:alpha-beta hydrolase superfamily lysophospholipase
VALATMRRDRLHARLGRKEHHDSMEMHVMAQEPARTTWSRLSAVLRHGNGEATPASASYVEVHGLRTWHEVTGAGQPVVLLHGAFAGAASWSGQAPVLADAGYKVHVPERRGHAHTPTSPVP